MVWHFHKDGKTGHTRLVLMPDETVPVVPVSQPASTTLPGVTTFTKKFECTVSGCGKKFATSGVFSIHYNRHHRQDASNKEEWRGAMKEITSGADPA